MKKYRVNSANTSYDELYDIAKNSGFQFFQGGKHTKVKTKDGAFITEIPRHNPLNKWTARSIAKALIKNGAEIDLI